MKRKDVDQIQSASVAELWKKVSELKRQIMDETYKKTHTSVKNVRAVKMLKKKLAVILTTIRAKDLSQER